MIFKTQIRLFNQCWPYKSLNHLAKPKNSNQVKAPKSYDVQDYMFRWWSLLCWQSLDLRSIKTETTEQKTCVLTSVKPARKDIEVLAALVNKSSRVRSWSNPEVFISGLEHLLTLETLFIREFKYKFKYTSTKVKD